MSGVAVTPRLLNGEVKFLVGNGNSRKLVFNRAELVALRSAIDKCLEAQHARHG